MFRTMMHPVVLPVLHARQDVAFRRARRLQRSSDDDGRNVWYPFEKLAEKACGSVLVASALHQYVPSIAVLVYGSPQGRSLATDREEDLVQMPRVATTRSPTAPFIGVRLPTPQTPLPHRFRTH